MSLEEHGIVDLFRYSSNDDIFLVTLGEFNLPEWLREEFKLHQPDLKRLLRRTKTAQFTIGVTT